MDTDDASRGEALLAGVRAAAAGYPDGRLPLPELLAWEIFPFEGSFQVKPLEDLQLPEPLRSGEGGVNCSLCEREPADALWTDGRWTVRSMPEPQPLFCAFLEPIAHVDLSDLDDDHASELGLHIVRVTRALETLAGVGRVHVNRWGDGAEHLHIWFFIRPAGMMQLRGSCLPDWFDTLPPMPQEQWDADVAALRVGLAAS